MFIDYFNWYLYQTHSDAQNKHRLPSETKQSRVLQFKLLLLQYV